MRRRNVLVYGLMSVLLMAGCGTAGGTNPSPRTATGSPMSPSGPSTGFRGLVQFTGTPARRAGVVGVLVITDWAESEPVEGQFDFRSLDAKLAQVRKQGLVPAIRLQTAMPNRQVEPGWLFAKPGQRGVDHDGTKIAVWWDPPYTEGLTKLIQAFADHIKTQNLLWVQGGIGIYGEAKVDAQFSGASGKRVSPRSAWEQVGYSDTLWDDLIQRFTKLWRDNVGGAHQLVVSVGKFVANTPGYDSERQVRELRDLQVWPQNDAYSVGKPIDPQYTTGVSIQEQNLGSAHSGHDVDAEIKEMVDVTGKGGGYCLIYGDDLAKADPKTLDYAASKITHA